MSLPAVSQHHEVPTVSVWTADQVALVKRTVAKGCDDDELALFLHIAKRTGLDPFARQLYAISRWDSRAGRNVMVVQTGIDGYRLVAERTGRYAPGPAPTYEYDDQLKVVTATAYVKKQTADGTWHEVAATAHFAEYAQKDRQGNPTRFWANMPHVMLSKVAEALALRRAFPMELSGIYTTDEMAHADSAKPARDTITKAEAKALVERAEAAGHTRDDLMRWLGVAKLSAVKREKYDAILARVERKEPFGEPLQDEEPGAITAEATRVPGEDDGDEKEI